MSWFQLLVQLGSLFFPSSYLLLYTSTQNNNEMENDEKMKNRNSTAASVVSVASGIVNDPTLATLATLATILFRKTHIRYQLPKWDLRRLEE